MPLGGDMQTTARLNDSGEQMVANQFCRRRRVNPNLVVHFFEASQSLWLPSERLVGGEFDLELTAASHVRGRPLVQQIERVPQPVDSLAVVSLNSGADS